MTRATAVRLADCQAGIRAVERELYRPVGSVTVERQEMLVAARDRLELRHARLSVRAWLGL